MNTSFSALKKNSQALLDNISKELEKINNPQGNSDEDKRFWKPTVDKAGNGMAVIRFLAAVDGEDVPWIQMFTHGFQGPTGLWYIENSRTTLGAGNPDPVSEYNSVLWNSTTDEKSPARDQARKQKRRLSYISNILVIKDSSAPENEGKVFLYQYGKKIFDKIKASMHPEFEDEEAVNPFDFWKGADFKLKIRQVDGYRNYDKSEFSDPAPLAQEDEAIEKIWVQQYKLKEFHDAKNFKTYDELKTKLERVLSTTATKATKKAEDVKDTPPWDDKTTEAKESKKETPASNDDDELANFLKDLED
jgi:hypothetical protein